jgi:hypothetical protein
MVERGVAPAGVVRSHALGRPRVTVRSHYGEPPTLGLDGTGRAGRKPRARGGEEPSVPVPEARSRSPKSPRWSAERRAPVRNGRGAARRPVCAPVGAPLPSPSGEAGMKARPAPLQGAAERWLNRSTGCLKLEAEILARRRRDVRPRTGRE